MTENQIKNFLLDVTEPLLSMGISSGMIVLLMTFLTFILCMIFLISSKIIAIVLYSLLYVFVIAFLILIWKDKRKFSGLTFANIVGQGLAPAENKVFF